MRSDTRAVTSIHGLGVFSLAISILDQPRFKGKNCAAWSHRRHFSRVHFPTFYTITVSSTNMFQWLEWLVTPSDQPPEAKADTTTPTSQSSPPSYSSRSQRPQSHLSRSSAQPGLSSPATSDQSRHSSPVRVKRESVEPSLVLDSKSMSQSPVSSSSRRSSISSRMLKLEDTEPNLFVMDYSVQSKGNILPDFSAESPPRGVVYDPERGARMMTMKEEHEIRQRELARLYQLKAVRECITPVYSGRDEDARNGPTEPVEKRRFHSRPHKSKRRSRVETEAFIVDRTSPLKTASSPVASDSPIHDAAGIHPYSTAAHLAVVDNTALPSVVTSIAHKEPTGNHQDSGEGRHTSIPQVHRSPPAAGPSSAVTSAQVTPPPPNLQPFPVEDTTRSLSRAFTWPSLKPADQSIKYANITLPHPSGRVASIMQKTATAKKRAKFRVVDKVHWDSIHSILYPVKHKHVKLEQEAKSLEYLARAGAQEMAKRAAEEARKAKEAEAARDAEKQRRYQRCCNQRTWQAELLEKLEEEQTRAEEIHVYRESLLTQFWTYEEKWKTLNKPAAQGETPLEWRCDEMPWPIFQSDALSMSGPKDITAKDVYFFVLHPLRPGVDLLTYAGRHHCLREEAARWDTEHFVNSVAGNVAENDRAAVLEGALHISALLRVLLEWEEGLGEWACWE
ncbi:hypothetical protein BC835DRAFT_465081 [Cytidiella melzeri]|nr:hypothetical protein BC835DRAFT_465081 [Cytidiella melzeri]